MKSKTRRYLLLGVLLLIVILIVAALFLRKTLNWEVEGQGRNIAMKSPVQSRALTPQVGVSSAGKITTPDHDKINAERELKLQMLFNTPINFFGKVVDEKNVPVAGASTFYIVGTSSLSGSPTIKGPMTDSFGQFSITGKRGPDFSVWVEHPDYYRTKSAHQKIQYARQEYTPGKEPPLPPTKDNPAIFVLKKKGVSEPLIYTKRIKARLPFDGDPINIDLRGGRVASSSESITIELHSKGDTAPINTAYQFDWSVSIRIPGGGLVERSDQLDFRAPSEGYVSEITIDVPSNLPGNDWKSFVEKDFFIKFSSGFYGRAKLNISGLKGRCLAETFLNPKRGSANLEFNELEAISPR